MDVGEEEIFVAEVTQPVLAQYPGDVTDATTERRFVEDIQHGLRWIRDLYRHTFPPNGCRAELPVFTDMFESKKLTLDFN